MEAYHAMIKLFIADLNLHKIVKTNDNKVKGKARVFPITTGQVMASHLTIIPS